MKEYYLATLKNGLRLITVPMPQLESATVMVAVGAGSRFETKKTNGLSHFLEHMAFKGTKKRPSALKIASEIDSVGGEFNAFTDREITAYYIKLAAKHQYLAFDILSDMLTSSLLKAEEIERERGVIIEEINMYEDTPMRRVQEIFIRLMYGDNQMGWDVAGEKTSVGQIRRKDFTGYIDSLYFASNQLVVVAGGVEIEQVQQLTGKYFAGIKKTGQKISNEIKISQNKSRLQLITKKTEQAHFCLGVPAYGYSHPDRYALGVLATILGGGMSSRLFTEVRERRGLAYYVGAEPDFYTDSGYLVAKAGVRLGKIEEAVKVVRGELEKISAKEVSLPELKRAQELLKGRMILALEDSQQVATRYAGQLLLEKKIRTPSQTLAEISRVTAEDILRVAKEIFRPEKLNLALIGPYKNENIFNKLIS